MEVNHPVGLVAVILALIVFHGSIYAVVSLNVGWRFGYWLTSAAMGGLMLFLSIFWVLTALGPRGEEPNWIPLAADPQQIGQVDLEEQTFTSPAQYPGGGWAEAEEESSLAQQIDPVTSSLSNCLTASPEALGEEFREACEGAQELLPAKEDLPTFEGVAVVMQPDFRDIRFTEEGGTQLAQVTVLPVTRDPRVADDPEEGEPVGDPFRMVAYFDPGSLRLPALVGLLLSVAYFGFHLWGLNRAERRKLSPIAE